MQPGMCPADEALFYSRGDSSDPRMGEIVRRLEQAPAGSLSGGADIIFLGVPEDRGIARNYGRKGASEGPDAIRSRFYKLTPGFNPDIMKLDIADAGNLETKGLSLENVHQALACAVERIITEGALPVVLGGGHDLSFPGIAGLAGGLKLAQGELGLVNIDSHLDVRSPEGGINSGTAFYRCLEEMPQDALHGRNFVEYGVQEPYNSPFAYNWVRDRGATVMTFRDVAGRPMERFLQALRIAGEGTKAVAVSVDIDAARQNEAPGASASNPSGLSALDLEKIAYLAGRTERVRYVDIMEMSPPLDEDKRTAALCASVVFWFLKGFCERR
ncbi:MAG: formimidoylglutamase [Thermovirgaceae bacterium]